MMSEAKGFGPGKRGDFVEVGAGGEEVRVAGNYQERRRMARQLFRCSDDRLQAGAREAIGAVAGNQAQNHGVAVRLDGAQIFLLEHEFTDG